MRPSLLFPLFTDVASLRGVGPRTAALYQKLCGGLAVDLLWHVPVNVIDRRYSPQLHYAEKDRIATLTLRIMEHMPPRAPSRPYRILGMDGSDQITFAYFNVKGDYLVKLFPTDRPIVVSGLLERYHGGWTMNHPDYVLPVERAGEIPKLEPVYPLTAGLTSKMVGKTVKQVLDPLPELTEWNDAALMAREKWADWRLAVRLVHAPEAAAESPFGKTARRRLAYDELLADQLALAVVRKHHRAAGGRAFLGDAELLKRFARGLPFELTAGQKKAAEEIAADMKEPKRMLRLLQGDVGSGKTVVALGAMVRAASSGAQAALMAPTEILARQHYERLSQLLAPTGLKIGLLVGRGRSRERAETLECLADGSLPLVVGTHALFQDEVKFKDLGLAVVDEQHRFGVQQRLQLAAKGRGVDILVMTATPIPRTLTLTAFGDMDVSRLEEKPAGRQPIDTRLIDMARLDEVIERLGKKLAAGGQAYWVCPLVEESEKSDLAAATERAELLRQQWGAEKVGLVHGRMKSEEKEAVMTAFAAGKIRALVATTVIEVGVDVANATVMVVEHAERFGLSQLHQLRGRVGRGTEASACLLLYQGPLGEVSKARLERLRETEDGFLIAEEDLRLRGPGEMLGTRQSGRPEFRLANLATDGDLLAMARDEAQLILNKDPALATDRGQALRHLLYLFQKDEAVPLFRAG